MNWTWVPAALIFAVVLGAFYMQFITARHKTHNRTHRMSQKRKFRPNWGRDRAEDGERRRGIQIRR